MKFMDPSVLCGPNKMKFMVQGADAQQFAMNPGDFVSCLLPTVLPLPPLNGKQASSPGDWCQDGFIECILYCDECDFLKVGPDPQTNNDGNKPKRHHDFKVTG